MILQDKNISNVQRGQFTTNSSSKKQAVSVGFKPDLVITYGHNNINLYGMGTGSSKYLHMNITNINTNGVGIQTYTMNGDSHTNAGFAEINSDGFIFYEGSYDYNCDFVAVQFNS